MYRTCRLFEEKQRRNAGAGVLLNTACALPLKRMRVACKLLRPSRSARCAPCNLCSRQIASTHTMEERRWTPPRAPREAGHKICRSWKHDPLLALLPFPCSRTPCFSLVPSELGFLFSFFFSFLFFFLGRSVIYYKAVSWCTNS